MTEECLFCIKYLADRLNSISEILEVNIDKVKLDHDFYIFKCDKNYWSDVAAALRELWPTGEKGEKYAWRDSVPNLAKRLQLLWSIRFPDKNYTKEQILQVARMYLARYENDMKYMKTLKYFILKQDKIVDQTGRIRYSSKSTLADMLEAAEEEGLLINENNMPDLFGNNIFMEEGELI